MPRDPGKVGIYCCGPTVYNLVHVGNARPYVIFAVLRSWLASPRLRGDAGREHHRRRRQDHQQGRTPRAATPAAVADEFTAAYLEDTDRLGLPRPGRRAAGHRDDPRDHRPRLPAHQRRPRLPGARQRLLPRAQLRRLRQALQAAHRRARGGRARRRRARQGRPARLRRVEGRQAGRAGLGQPLGHGPAGLAHRVLGHGPAVPGRRLRHPRRRPRPHLPAPRERDRPERGGRPAVRRVWMHNGMLRSEARRWPRAWATSSCCARCSTATTRAVVLTYFLTTHYRSPLEFSHEKLDEAKAAYERLAEALRDLDFRVANAGRPASAASGRTCAARRGAPGGLRRAHGRRSQHGRRPRRAVRPGRRAATATWRAVDAARRRSTPTRSKASTTSCGVARRAARSRVPAPAPAITERRHASPATTARLRHRRRRAAAGRPAGRGGPLGRRRAGLRRQRSRAATPPTPACCATTTAPRRTGPTPTACATRSRRPASRCATRRRAPRSCAEVGRGWAAEEQRAHERGEPSMPPATPARNAAVASRSARAWSCARARPRIASARAVAAPATAAPAATASRPPCMTATGSSVTTGGTRTTSVSAPRRRGLRPQSAATASSATGESTVHQNSVRMATAANEPAETSMGMRESTVRTGASWRDGVALRRDVVRLPWGRRRRRATGSPRPRRPWTPRRLVPRGLPVETVERARARRAHRQPRAPGRRPAGRRLPVRAAERCSARTLVVVLDEVSDPRNLGAVARSALAAGAGGLVVPRHRSAAVTPAAVKASAGATRAPASPT